MGKETTNHADASEADLVLDSFLAFLTGDIASHLERLLALDTGIVELIHVLTDRVRLDLDAPLLLNDE